MRTVVLASIRCYTRRYVAAATAVVVGVVFVVVTGALSSAARSGMVAGVEAPFADADVVVSDLAGDDVVRLLRHADERGADALVVGWASQSVSDEGRLVGDRLDVGFVADGTAMRWQRLVDGRFPSGRGEAVVDAPLAEAHDVGVGDRLRVGRGARAVDVAVVGLVESPSLFARASVYLTRADQEQWLASAYVDSVAYRGDGTAGEQADELAEVVPGARVRARDAFVDDRQTEINNGVDVLAIILLLFAGIALFVSVLVIANTFSIMFTQRLRDLALLRCVGATRRQVLRSVRVEALALGVAATVAGLAAGIAGGYGLVASIRSLWPDAGLGDVRLSAGWLLGAAAVGILVTLVASWLPTRRVVRVSPLAALRPTEDVPLRSAAGRVRLATGLALGLGGPLLLAGAVAAHSPTLLVVGGGASFAGLLVLGPVLFPLAVRLAGWVSGPWSGPAGRLAAANAVRHPRRTSATTASLLVGVTLTTAVLTGMAGARAAIGGEMDQQHPIDLSLTTSSAALAPTVLDTVRATPGVGTAEPVVGAPARVSDGVGRLQLLAPDDAATGLLRDDAALRVAPGWVRVPWELLGDLEHGDRVRVSTRTGTRTLRVAGGEGWGGGAALVAPATLAGLEQAPTVRAVWLRASDGADPDALATRLGGVAQSADADVESGLATRAYVDLQLDVLTGTVIALLGVSILIALVGIGNTLGLSVLERVREHALLRALGLTRRQLRATLAAEALLLSVVATVVGVATGVLFAWVGTLTLVRPVVDDAALVVPWTQLVLVVLVAALAGLGACLLPARRAARVEPATGLAVT